jgi:hypothetical protein
VTAVWADSLVVVNSSLSLSLSLSRGALLLLCHAQPTFRPPATQVSTTIYSQASVHFAPDVASPLDDVDRHHHSGRRDRDRDRVHFTSKKRHEVAGSIRGTGSGAGSDSSTTAAGVANDLATSGRQLLSQNVTKVVAKGPAEIYFF